MTNAGAEPEKPDGGGGPGRFIVDFGDLSLSTEASERIAQSIQRAVLLEIAGLDLAPRYGVSFTAPRALLAGGPTQGMWVESAEPQA